MAYPDTRRIREMQAATKAAQAEEEARLAEEARRAEEAARRESAIKQQAASQATERQPIKFPKSTAENAQETLADPRFSPQPKEDPMMLPKSQGQPGSTPSTPKNLDFPGESMSSSAERIRQKKIAADRNEGISGDPSVTTATDGSGTVDEATRARAVRMADDGLSGDTNIIGSIRIDEGSGDLVDGVEWSTLSDEDDMTQGRRRFWTASDAQPDLEYAHEGAVGIESRDYDENEDDRTRLRWRTGSGSGPQWTPESPEAQWDAAVAMKEQDEQEAKAKAETARVKGDALEDAYGNFLQSLQASGQKKMLAYYMNPDPNEDGKTGKQLFIEDVLESDQNSPEEQQAAMGEISRAQDRRFTNKVPDFDEDTGNRPGAGRQATNEARGTREFERRLDQKNIPEKLRDPNKNMVPTNMFDPETGEPGIAGQSPTMVGEGMPKREGASAIYGPPGTNWKRRGMDMGDQHGPNGSGDGDANYMLSLMTEENWNNLRDQDRRDLVMNLANRLGYLDGIKELPEEDQYYAAKRAVFSHIFQTGDGAQRIWANNEAELGENSDLIDPNKKPMLENVWDDNTGQWVLKQSQDSRDRARMRSATAFASRGMKGHSQIDQYMNPDGTMNTEAAGAKMLEVINKERVNMGQEPVSSVDELNENERLAYDQGMRLLYDMPQHARVKQNNLDQGRGQMMMGHAGNASQWRLLGAYNRELDAAETLEEKAEIARKYGNRVDMTRFDEGANAQADRDAAAQATELERADKERSIQLAIKEADKQRASAEKIAEINSKQGQETSPGYTDQLRAAEGDPVMMQYAHEEEFKKQLASMANEGGTVTWDQIRQNNAAIAVLNNMYLDPNMGRSWTEWWNDEEMGDVQMKKFVVGQKAYVDSILDMLGLNVPGREEELEAARAWAMDNYIKKFRSVNPMGAHSLGLDADPAPPAAGQVNAQPAAGQVNAQETQEQETQEPVTNGKPIQGPQEDSLPAIPSGNAPGTRARRRNKKVTGSPINLRVPFEANPNYSPTK